MNTIHSHPAHRNVVTIDKPPREEADEFIEALRLIAETPMTTETPGVARDEFTDEMIFRAREWIRREDRTKKFLAELGG